MLTCEVELWADICSINALRRTSRVVSTESGSIGIENKPRSQLRLTPASNSSIVDSVSLWMAAASGLSECTSRARCLNAVSMASQEASQATPSTAHASSTVSWVKMY
jgi:hypothetical protein